jgi:hypothetical protein
MANSIQYSTRVPRMFDTCFDCSWGRGGGPGRVGGRGREDIQLYSIIYQRFILCSAAILRCVQREKIEKKSWRTKNYHGCELKMRWMVDLKVVEGELELVNLGPVIVQILAQLGQGRLQWFPASGASPFNRKITKRQQGKTLIFQSRCSAFSLNFTVKKYRVTSVADPDPLVRGTDQAQDSALDPAPDPSIIKQK